MLRQTVLKEKCHAGLAVDGDADRIGAVAEDGSFVDSHKCFLSFAWVLERKKWTGDVVRAFNTTGMVDRIAARYGRKLIECPIGFKYIADLMMEHEIVVGGEESGGIGYSRYLPERDGTLNCLLLANVMAEEQKPLGQLVADLQREYGPHYYGRRDLHITEEMKLSAIQRAGSDQTNHLGRYSIKKKEGLDGIKLFLEFPRRPKRQRSCTLGVVSDVRDRAAATCLLRSLFARTGERYSLHCGGICPGRRFVRTIPRLRGRHDNHWPSGSRIWFLAIR